MDWRQGYYISTIINTGTIIAFTVCDLSLAIRCHLATAGQTPDHRIECQVTANPHSEEM